jgi:hypothetical protein
MAIDIVHLAALGFIDEIEQGRKRATQGDTSPASCTDVEYAREFVIERALIVERLGTPIEGVPRRRLETAFFVRHESTLLVH